MPGGSAGRAGGRPRGDERAGRSAARLRGPPLSERGPARPALRRIVSGGQTGVDRAALDAAAAAGLASGGWCPAGRGAEDGPIPARYPLRETPEARPEQRTAWNVRDSDATLVLLRGEPRGGTATTIACAREAGRALRVVRLGAAGEPGATRRWLAERGVACLNVAGPRESEEPGIAADARAWLDRLLGDGAPRPPRGAA